MCASEPVISKPESTPLEQSVGRVVYATEKALCAPAALCEDGVHGREVSQGGVPVPHCDTAGEDAFQ